MAMSRHLGVDIPAYGSPAAAVAAGEVLQAREAFFERTAPKSLTGCVSGVSACTPVNHAYTDALKNYAEVYEAFQAYLSPLDTVAAHDYDRAIAMSVPENSHFGCINDDMVEFIASTRSKIADEDIESCGYLGWLQH